MLNRCVRKLMCGLCLIVGVVASPAAMGQGRVTETRGVWTMLDDVPAGEAGAAAWVRPIEYRAARLAYDRLLMELGAAPLEGTPAADRPITLELPHPGGGFRRFAVVESPVMEPKLAAATGWRTFSGQGIDEPATTVRCDVTALGFRAQVLGPGGAWYVDPYSRGDASLVTAYFARDAAKELPPFRCTALADAAPATPRMRLRGSVAGTLREFRFAAATTGEFTEWAGGRTPALAVVVTSVNRLNQIFERELAVRFTLVASNQNVVYASGAADPYTDPDASAACLDQNQTAVDFAIGPANYDLGHVLHKSGPGGSNGVAQLGSVCRGGSKARGYTAYENPAQPEFVTQYLAHEVGHQLGAHHTHNNCGGSPGDAPQYLVEPGSGTTIMSYAGICGSTNIQALGDAYFHAVSFDQMLATLQSAGCGDSAPTGNAPPVVDAGPEYSIPLRTPFTLTAAGLDPDGDALTYAWECLDAGPLIGVPVGPNDNGQSPIIRSRPPVAGPSRTVPAPADLAAGVEDRAEALPRVARTMRWRVTARDNRAGGGGVSAADTTVRAVDTGAAFRVTAPSEPGPFAGTLAVRWDVAGTTADPISCGAVRVLMSVDGGLTFPLVLAQSVPNIGQASVPLPAGVNTSLGRVKVEAVGNIFFAISAVNFAIGTGGTGASFGPGGPVGVNDSQGNGNANGAADPGETALRLTIPVRNTSTTIATGVTALLTSDDPNVTVLAAQSAYPNMAGGGSAVNAAPFVVALSAAMPCGGAARMSLIVSSEQGSSTVPVRLRTGQLEGVNTSTFAWGGPPVPIPDFSAAGATADVPVVGAGSVSDVDLLLAPVGGGATCTTSSSSAVPGIAHSAVGDLVITLRSPSGTEVTLVNRAGSPGPSTGNNFCATTLDDDGATSIQAIASSGAPYSDSYSPANPFSAFAGEPADGVWTLKVQDLARADTGRLQGFSLRFRTGAPVCAPPLVLTGACCAPAGDCSAVQAALCSGQYLGDGVACAPNPCPQPVGACCQGGTCSTLTRAECARTGGSYQGDGAACTPAVCPSPLGACCEASGACALSAAAGCPGAFRGVGTVCEPNPCPQPLGRCCSSGGACAATTRTACAGAWTFGAGCGPDACPVAALGTCCAPTGACAVTEQAACTAGAWSAGAACEPGNPCPQPTASCCAPGSPCVVTFRGNCSGTWGASASCSPSPCPQASGACCLPGGCSPSNPSLCTLGGGTFLGAGVPCGPASCARLCCAGSTCALVVASQCTGGTTRAGAVIGTDVACSTTSATAPCCKADYNKRDGVDLFDIFDYLEDWFVLAPFTDFDGQNGPDLLDIFAFLEAWFAGCV